MSKRGRIRGKDDGKVRGHFAMLPDFIANSAAYRSLKPNAKCLLVELILLYNGQNNGLFWLSETDAGARIGVSCNKVIRGAFIELMESGLIRMSTNAYFNVKTGERRSRCWLLTWKGDNLNRKPPSNEWKNFSPNNTSVIKRIEKAFHAVSKYTKDKSKKQNDGGKSPAMNDNNIFIQGKSPAMNIDIDAKLPKTDKTIQGEIPPHIDIPWGIEKQHRNNNIVEPSNAENGIEECGNFIKNELEILCSPNNAQSLESVAVKVGLSANDIKTAYQGNNNITPMKQLAIHQAIRALNMIVESNQHD